MNQSKLFAGLTGVAALALVTACSAEEPAPDEQPADQQTEQQEATTPADSPDTATTEPTETTEDTGNDATESPASGGDEVYSIIEAVESEYSGGFIVDIDRDDEGSMYEVDVVADNEVYQLDVSADGTINVDETDTDEDDIREAEQASVPVTEALDEAFNQHPDSTFDQIQLDEDDGSIHWEIDLDDANGSEVELNVPAA